jgi:hypothetical protein
VILSVMHHHEDPSDCTKGRVKLVSRRESAASGYGYKGRRLPDMGDCEYIEKYSRGELTRSSPPC